MTHGTASLSLWEFTTIAMNVSLVLAAVIYIRGWFSARNTFPLRFSAYRLASFLLGILCVWIATGSPVESLVHFSLTFHMVQHLLLMAIAPPLILFGAPVLPLLSGLPQTIVQRVVVPILSWNVVKRIGRLLTHPAFCWLSASFVLIGWHVPTIFEHAMRRHWLHELERASFFGMGLLFWWPVIQPWPSIAKCPRWVIPFYLFCATLPCDALSAFLVFCDRVVYTSYLHTPGALNFSPLQDQDFAAALMWVTETVILMVPAVVITLKLLSPRTSSVQQNDTHLIVNCSAHR
jgi:putative membrane protein